MLAQINPDTIRCAEHTRLPKGAAIDRKAVTRNFLDHLVFRMIGKPKRQSQRRKCRLGLQFVRYVVRLCVSIIF